MVTGSICMACDGGGTRDRAFALESPLRVFNTQNSGAAQDFSVPFGEMLEVGRVAVGGLVQLCESGLWVDPVFLATIDQPRFGTIPADRAGVERPELKFWREIGRLEQFLSGVGASEFGPDVEQLRTSAGETSFRLPMLDRSWMASMAGPVEVAELLLPIDAVTLKVWGRIREAEAKPMPLLVLDASGNAETFAQDLIRGVLPDLIDSDSRGGLIVLGPSDAASAVTALSRAALLDLTPGAAGGGGLSRTLTDLGDDRGRDVVLLLAGDHSLPDAAVLRHASTITVAQITPELDPELQSSLAVLPPDAVLTYLEFSADQGRLLLPILAAILGPPEGGMAQGLGEMTTAQIKAGYLPVLPITEAGRTGFEASDGGVDWIGLRVWTVANDLLLTLDK